MRLGQRTRCAWCSTVYPYGVRPMPEGMERYCSTACAEVGEAHKEVKVEPTNRDVADWLASPVVLKMMLRASELKRAYCNRCVTDMAWSPALDGSQCSDCGYALSLYGPFEEPPSLCPIMVPLKASWWTSAHPPQ